MLSLILFLAGVAAGDTASASVQSRYIANVEISVTDRAGTPIPAARLAVRGLTDRDGVTGDQGKLLLPNLPAGIYTLRAERETFIPFEMKFTVKGGETVQVVAALSSSRPAPSQTDAAGVARPVPMPSASSPATAVRLASTTTGSPRILSIPDFAEHQLMKPQAPQESPISCSGLAAARLIQVREPIAGHTHADADEMLYVVAGDGTLTIGDVEQRIAPGWFSMVPRGTAHSISRRGRNPVVVLSMVAGQPCP